MGHIRLSKAYQVIDMLDEIVRIASMENANFDGCTNTTVLTDLIKNKTKLWRNTYIIDPAKKATSILKNEINRNDHTA